MDLQERLKQFIDSKGLTYSRFEKMCGFGNGTAKRFNETIKRRTLDSISSNFPELNIAWLLNGEGEMIRYDDLSIEDDRPVPTPLYAMEAVAGFRDGRPCDSGIEEYIQWYGSREGDIAVHVNGDSMSPRIPNGSIVLVRAYTFTDFEDLEFGKVHIVVTNDDKVLLKILRYDKDQPAHLLLCSYNENYPPRSIAVENVARVYLAVSYQAPL